MRNINSFVLDEKSYQQRKGSCLNISIFRYEGSNVILMRVRPHYYRVRQVEPYHRLDEAIELCLNSSYCYRWEHKLKAVVVMQ